MILVELTVYVLVGSTDGALHRVCDIVLYCLLAASVKWENDGIYGHTYEDPNIDEWLDVVDISSD